MNAISSAALTLAIGLAACGAVSAQSTGMEKGSADHGMGMMRAKCSPGDANVMVDTKKKTYYVDAAPVAAVAGASSMSHTGDEAAADQRDAMAHSMKSMCASEATSMGAKAVPAPSPAASAAP